MKAEGKLKFVIYDYYIDLYSRAADDQHACEVELNKCEQLIKEFNIKSFEELRTLLVKGTLL